MKIQQFNNSRLNYTKNGRDAYQEHDFGVERGFTPVKRRNDNFWHNFVKGNFHVWFCSMGYAVAELINGRYSNHNYFQSIDAAFNYADSKIGY
jgi:hypothetical protein